MSPFLHGCRGELEGRILRQFAGCVSSILRLALHSSYGTEDDVQPEPDPVDAVCMVYLVVITTA